MQRKHFKTVDEYIDSFPKDVAQRLKTIRKTIKNLVPQATEVISYNIPAYKLDGIFIYFAGFKDHVSVYPYSVSMGLTKKELLKYRTGKGTLQFPNDEKFPVTFIQKIVKNKAKDKVGKKK